MDYFAVIKMITLFTKQKDTQRKQIWLPKGSGEDKSGIWDEQI